MRFFLAPALLLFIASACTPPTDELLPIPASVKGASNVRHVDVSYGRGAAAALSAMDASRERAGNPKGAANLSLPELLERSIREATQEAGLTSGRALKLLVEVDAFQAPSAGSAFLGKDDRLEGSVFVRDAETGEALGQLYIDIDRANGGLMSALARIGNVRESLARQFGEEVAKALGGRPRAR